MITSTLRNAWKTLENRGKVEGATVYAWSGSGKKGISVQLGRNDWPLIQESYLHEAINKRGNEIIRVIVQILEEEMAKKEQELKEAYMKEIKESFEEMGLELRITCSGPTDPREE